MTLHYLPVAFERLYVGVHRPDTVPSMVPRCLYTPSWHSGRAYFASSEKWRLTGEDTCLGRLHVCARDELAMMRRTFPRYSGTHVIGSENIL